MSTGAVSASSFRASIVDRLQPERREGYLRYHTELGDDSRHTQATATLLTYLLAGIESKATNYDAVGPIARVELFWNRERGGYEGWRGAVLFDNKGKAIFHAVHALLGYGGAGPALSEHILRCLDVPEALFQEANSAVHNQDYLVVFSREQRIIIDGVESSLPFGEPGAWEWWRVR